jgi:hypothetical protein
VIPDPKNKCCIGGVFNDKLTLTRTMEYADKLYDEVKLRFKKNETELRIHHLETDEYLARGLLDLRNNLDVEKEIILDLNQATGDN